MKEKMKITVDMGNTAIKVAVFEKDTILHRLRAESWNDALAEELVTGFNPTAVIVSSTRSDGEEVVDGFRLALSRHGMDGCKVMRLSGQTPTPIVNRYESPEMLGPDRIAAAVGGATLIPSRNLLIVDLGTAITFDVVSAEGEFLGGNISPGVSMRFEALHRSAALLPREEMGGEEVSRRKIGKKTADAIKYGIVDGICYEIEGYIKEMGSRYENLVTIFTGGDAKSFEKRLKNTIFAELDLVSIGLNKILEYNGF